MAESKTKFTFRGKDFYGLLTKQNYLCALTGLELTPESTSAEHIQPLRKGGKHEAKNICLVNSEIARLKRGNTDQEVVDFAAKILEFRGSEFGYTVTKKSRKTRKAR